MHRSGSFCKVFLAADRWAKSRQLLLNLVVPGSLQQADSGVRISPCKRLASDRGAWGLLAWIAGCGVPLLANRLLENSAQIVAVAAVLMPLAAWVSYRRGAWRAVVFPLAACLLAAALANHRFIALHEAQVPSDWERIDLRVSGQVEGLPRSTDGNIRFYFTVRQSELPALIDQRVQLSCYRCRHEIQAGQQWQFIVRLKKPNGYASWGSFDYEQYLFRQKVVAKGYLRSSEVNQLRATDLWSIHRWRQQLREQLAAVIPQPGVGRAIMLALMIGDRSGLSSDERQSLQMTGVSHLLAISGLHIGLVYMACIWLSQAVLWPATRIYTLVSRPTLSMLLALLVATGYAALAGFAVSTQRALLMLAIYTLSRCVARDNSLGRVLLLTVAVLLAADPFALLDAGFWLSCSAVAVIAVCTGRHASLSLWRLQPWLWLGMLPLTLGLFGQVSIISPVVNLVAVPLFCLLLIPLNLLGLLAMLLLPPDLVAPGLGLLQNCFDYVFRLLEWLARQPLASMTPAHSHNVLLLGITLLVFLAMAGRLRLWIPLGMLTLMLGWRAPALQPDQYRVTLLDVGQGLAMVVEAQDYTMVYDTGPAYGTGFTTAQAVLIPYLRYRGIQRIDTLVISHADNDHIGGLDTLLQHYPVSRILTSRPDRVAHSESCNRGQHWRRGMISFAMLGPEPGTPAGSNNLSCVLRISNGELTTLITGDIERPVETFMLRADLDLRADFMLVPHQGSKTSSSEGFLDAVRPRVAMLAAGYRNHYGHPHEDIVRRYRERKIKLVSTIDKGSILLNVIGNEYLLTSWREDQGGFWQRQKKPN